MTRERNYVTANELAETLGVSTGQAYKIIRRLNNELDKKALLPYQANVHGAIWKRNGMGMVNKGGIKHGIKR